MSFGAEFRNDASKVVISDSRVIETFIGKATYNHSGLKWSYGNLSSRTDKAIHRYFISSPVRPIAFLHTKSNVYAAVAAIKQLSGGFMVEVASSSIQPSDVTVYCFAQVPQGGVDQGYGMNIYDSNGNPVFSSNWVILNVRGIVVPGDAGQTIDHNISGLAKPAAAASANSGRQIRNDGESGGSWWYDRRVYKHAYHVTRTTISTAFVYTFFDGDNGWGSNEAAKQSAKDNYNMDLSVPPAPVPIIDAAQYD